MRAFLAYLNMSLRLTLRDRSVIFFNYLFPLIIFFFFSYAFRAAQTGLGNMVFAMSTVIGVLANGLFGAGMRMVADREANILRRFKVAPITPLMIIVSSIITGLITYLPSVLLTFALGHFLFNVAVPANWPSLAVLVIIGVCAFRSIGLIAASVANSSAESQIIIQLLYFPSMFLSGATFPLDAFPKWLQVVSQFIPSTHLNTGVQGILIQGETLVQNASAIAALVLTAIVGCFVSYQLFRWEKEEKLKSSSKLWVLAALAPFFLLGAMEIRTGANLQRLRQIDRQASRQRPRLFTNARIISGDGNVIQKASLLVRQGKIDRLFTGDTPDAKALNADEIESSGKTIIPGLIDAHVHLGAPGGYYATPADYNKPDRQERALAAYLYSGITAVRSTGDWLDDSLTTRQRIAGDLYEGAELLTAGPLFTTAGGHPTQMLHYMPESMRQTGEKQFVRLPATQDEARQMVRDLKQRGVNLIKGVLEGGYSFKRMDVEILRAAVAEAKAQGLPVAIHTGSAQDVADAIEVGATSIEHGSLWQPIPDALFEKMKAKGIFYVATLSVGEGVMNFAKGDTSLLERPLLQQAAPAKLLRDTKATINNPEMLKMREAMAKGGEINLEVAFRNAARAHTLGVKVVAGSDAGNPLVIHGPTTHREMQLLVKAGLPPAAAITAATGHAAELLGIARRTGTIAPGKEATFLVLDANPLDDIGATERISIILNKGERVSRPDLLTQKLD